MEKKRLAIVIAILLIVVIVTIVLAVVLSKDDDNDEVKATPIATTTTTTTTTAPPVTGPPLSQAEIPAEHYLDAAVASDREECSVVGRDILQKGGSAVDSAVATLFCVGLFNMHSCGIGGGGFMNVYIRAESRSIIYDFRETAPAAATEDMYAADKNTSSRVGGLAIGVPGNVKGLHHVWSKHGKLAWKDLVNPTIKIAEEGFKITDTLGDKIIRDFKKLNASAGFRELLLKPDGTWYKSGEILKNQKLADTLEIVRDTPEDFYTGNLAKQIVDDITEAGGIITLEDLKNYTVAERQPLVTEIDGMKLYLMPPPGSGSVIGMTMNILKGFNLAMSDDSTDEKRIETFHKIVEALKFAFARRPLLGDPSFEPDVDRVTDAMLNQTFAEMLRKKINLTSVYPNQTYYGGYYSQDEDPYGTTHVSILAKNGDAVSTTDTINYSFGGGVRSTRNGIIYNNEMDDFSTPGLQNIWGYLPAEANFIKPGKRPLSSMSPTIVVNSAGDVIMIAGASGGSRIITSVALTLIRKLYMNIELGKSVAQRRVHTHLLPYELYISQPFPLPQTIITGLANKGHKIVMSSNAAAVQAVYRSAKGGIIAAKSDPRKGGKPAGVGQIPADHYKNAAVAADREECSVVGRDILKRGGSAVDSTVATLFCVGLFNMHSCGIGGGGFMNVYIRAESRSIIYDFRETAPAAATEDMYAADKTKSRFGGLAVGIPGNVKGLRHVWNKHGNLAWKHLVNPTIKMAEDGFKIPGDLGDKIQRDKETLNKSAGFRELLLKPDGTWYKAGEILKNQKLADTLKIVRDTPEDFYTGNLAKEIVDDITEAGGIITLEDLKNYTVAERQPLVTEIDGMKLYLMPPPGSGSVIGMTMNILAGFNLTLDDDSTDEKRTKTFHKIVEALKFAFARRPLLGDPSFELNVTEVTDAMLNQTFAEMLRKKINLTSAYPNQTYYGGYYSQFEDPYGTTHVSILAKNGDAVGCTDTINYGFGSGVRSTRNGIIYNNEMDDFSTPGLQNIWGYLPAKANFIKPGKRPLSSMSPTIVVNSDGDVIMVAGASGGSRIITAVALTMIRKLYMKIELGKSVSQRRVHTHLLPYNLYITQPFPLPQTIITGLANMGHNVTMSSNWAAVQALYRATKNDMIAAKSDPRKGGIPAGY